MSNKSNLNTFQSFELSQDNQRMVSGGAAPSVESLEAELKELQLEYNSLTSTSKQEAKSDYFITRDVIRCEIDRLSKSGGGNGDGVW